MREPDLKRAITFIDGQNLFHAARAAFGHKHPNYDVVTLSEAVCRAHNWSLRQVRFYTGVPDLRDDARWHTFWSKKLSVMGKMGVAIYSRPLRYRNRVVLLPGGIEYSFRAGEEKGIDVRISLDAIRHAMHDRFDVGVIFSQDQDFSEVAEEIRAITGGQSPSQTALVRPPWFSEPDEGKSVTEQRITEQSWRDASQN
jgi:uncharacterized LabA/DUF88 family protein